MYGHRARIGYTVAAVTTEVFPIDWYKIVPDGVTLMMVMLPLGERSPDDVKKCYDVSIEAAQTMATAGADIVLLGGLPIYLSRGGESLSDLMKRLERQVGVPVTSSTTAQQKAYKALGSRKVGTVHPFKPDQNARHEKYLKDFFGLEPAGVYAGGWDLKTLGKIPIDAALQWGRALKKEHPEIDTFNFACPHWRVVDAIEPLEQELKVSVMTSLQAIAWEAMRTAGVNDRIEGFGRLLREH
ncbi:MAG: maleate isomerase [Alphaproteobacteria bacterium]|nr:maleate isomerase [Alphaproteobacteria bacterium]